MLAIKNKRGIILISEGHKAESDMRRKIVLIFYKEKNYVNIKNKLRININQF